MDENGTLFDSELTEKEEKAITKLRALAKVWPDTLWLFSGSGSLCVMKYLEDGERGVTATGGMDPDCMVAQVQGINNDGGDW